MRLHSTILALGALTMLAACSGKKETQKPATSHSVMVVKPANHMLESDFAASVKGRQTVEVRPQVDGMITRICIHEGDPVRMGQVLFEIESAQFKAAYDVAQANVNSAEAAVSTAQLVYEANKELRSEDVISDFELNTSRNELAEANAKLRLAKAELERAATNLGYTQVKSPVNGIASLIPYRVGALVNSGITQPLVTVSDDAQVYAYFSMSENEMLNMMRQHGSMHEAMEKFPDVKFRMSNGDVYPHPGRIDAVSGTINNSTGAVSFRAVFPNPDRMLRDGASGSVIIPQEYSNQIVIPKAATFELQDKVFVYKVVDGKASSSEITVLPQNNGREYVVTAGLAEGDVIVAEGAGLIREGAEINPKQQPQTQQ